LRPFRPGIAFKDGKLYRYTPTSVTVMRLWPDPRAWRKSVYWPAWVGCRPRINLERWARAAARKPGPRVPSPQLWLPGLEPRRGRPVAEVYRQAIAEIPEEVRKLVTRYHYGHWDLLNLLARCPGADDLVEANPALAMALSWTSGLRPGPHPWRAARRLVQRRQREIAGALGFPATESAVRVLRKIPVGEVIHWHLYHMREPMAHPDVMKTLAHLPRVNYGVIHLIVDEELRRHATPTFYTELSALDGAESFEEAFYVGWVDGLRRQCRPGWRLPVFRSIKQMRELVADLEDERARIRGAPPFPPPPVPGSDSLDLLGDVTVERGTAAPNGADPIEILPITEMRELVREGDEQKNCAASYAHEVLAGEVYLYRMLAPQRATLALVRSGSGWKLDDIRASCNRRVGKRAHSAVERWLEAALRR
jgi:hypothetical protein